MTAANRAATDPGAPDARTATRRLLPLTEAAEILSVSVKTVRRYVAAGELDAVRLGRRTFRSKVDSIERLIDAEGAPRQWLARAVELVSVRCSVKPRGVSR